MNKLTHFALVGLLAVSGVGCTAERSYVGHWEALEAPDRLDRPIATLTLSENGLYYLSTVRNGKLETSCGNWRKTPGFDHLTLTDGLTAKPCTYDVSDRLLQCPRGDRILYFERRYTVEKYVEMLDSNDGRERQRATQRLFAMGPGIAPELQRLGAQHYTPFGRVPWRRVDSICTLMLGLRSNEPNARAGYLLDSFGMMLDAGTTNKDVDEMGKRHGFSRDHWQVHPAPEFPSCYVQLEPGKDLATVMREVLLSEPSVQSVMVNYFWR